MVTTAMLPHMAVVAPALAVQHIDHFGNHIDIYRIDKPHTRFDIEVRAAIDVRFPDPPPAASTPRWEDIRAEVLRRIRARQWPPGGLIPGEESLAQEFNVARATVKVVVARPTHQRVGPGLAALTLAATGILHGMAFVEDNDPVVFFEPKRIYNGPFSGYYDRPVEPWSKHDGSAVPEGYYRIDLGKAAVVREGEAVTVLTYGTMVHVVKAVVAEHGIDAEIIDLRTLLPLDIETIEASVKKTGRCMVVHEATRTSGFGAELAAQVQERCFYHLEAPIERVTGFDTPYPHSLEWAYFPGPVRLARAFDKIMKD